MISPIGRPTIAIVGGGAVGAALVQRLVEASSELALRARPRIVVFEKSGSIGRGLAYAEDEAPYLLNQSAETMSLVPGRRSDFFDWLARRGLARADGGELFCARALFGAYVEESFASAVERARACGVAVTAIRDEVTCVVPCASGGHRVVTRTHAPVDADFVVLALGNLPSRRFLALEGAGWVGSPYPSADMRARIAPDARVAILGTGLGAIDAALATFAAGHRAPITMASRSGLLPAVRGPLRPIELHHVTRAAVARATDDGRRPLRWGTVLGWLARELERHGEQVSWDRDFPAYVEPLAHYEAEVAAAERGPRVWQSIGEALNPMIEVLWHHLAEDDRRLFVERFQSRFVSHWVPIPLQTARRVLGLLREGRLVVERGVAEVSRAHETSAFSMRLPTRVAAFDVVIDATGVPRHLSDCDSPLVDSLLRSGTIAAHEHGGIRVDFASLRVIGAAGRPDPSLFAIGNLTNGTHLFTSTLELCVEKADRVAARIVDELRRRTEREPHVDAAPRSS